MLYSCAQRLVFRVKLTAQSLHAIPHTGPHLKVKEDGTFTCVVCGNTLFKTDKKFESGTGWPSFSDVASKSDSVVRVVDDSLGMVSEDLSLTVRASSLCLQLSPQPPR